MSSTYSKPKPGTHIVITGMSGKFPDSNDVYHFRDNLFNKIDMISDDFRRWKPVYPKVPQRTGKMFNIDRFDVGFFGVPQKQVDNMDPMIRGLLEKVYEAILDAGYHPFDFEGSNVGVYVGTCFSETEKSAFGDKIVDSGGVTCCQRSMIAKRISYFFKLNGVSFITDTGCSSSLFALEHAYRHLKAERCRKAIVCGTQLCLHPILSLQFARLGVLSPDGICKSFDDAGNGYVRSEAITAIILEKSKDAKRIYAEIIHSKTNCDGYKEEGITFPSSEMQKILMKEFYKECNVDPADITFIEAHATGTKVGDPEELKSIDEVFCKARIKPLHIGSVKSNIGHSEAVSGLCSIVKVLIGFETGFIPPNRNYSTPKKGVQALEKGRLVVVTERTPWLDQNGLVGINSFGFGGANAHVLLRWNPKIKTNNGIPNDNLPRLVCVSGRVKEAVTSILDAASKVDVEFIKLVHQVFRSNIPNQLYNGYAIVTKRGEIERVLSKNRNRNKLKVVFGNVDSDWYRLGEKLLDLSLFSELIQKIKELFKKELKVSWVLSTKSENVINQILATVTVQLALADIIKNLRLDIHEITGIGYGELIAAYLDGCLSLKDVLFLTYYISSGTTNKLNILSKKSRRINKWLPTHHMDNFYPEYYFTQYISLSASSEDNQNEPTPDNVINLIIGPWKRNTSENDIILIRDTLNPIVELLQSLGRLFLFGFPGHLDILYPTITFPVSRGTHMLSPHIKWDHSKSYTVHHHKSEEERKTGQRLVHISERIEEWNFISGHVVNGRNIFPVTGYLVLVWETLAIILNKLMSDTCVVFEDVKFLRAVTVPPEETLSLRVIIPSGNKFFEIVDKDTVLVTGRVYSMSDDEKLVDVHLGDVHLGDNEINESDVYREFRLRGYHFNEQFRGIKKLSLKGNKGVISWRNNWITFMDNMLQIRIFDKDRRSLCMSTSIKRVIIDGPRHTKHVIDCNNEILVSYNKDAGIIRGGGIEIIGVGASVIPRKKPPKAVLETYKFVPYQGKMKQKQVIRCMVQIILENVDTIKVKCLEILNDHDEDVPIIPLVQEALVHLPLLQPEFKLLTKRKDVHLPNITIENKNLNTESSCLILIARNIIPNPELLSIGLRVIKDVSGFIITKESAHEIPSEIQILSSYQTENGNWLLIKQRGENVEKISINVSSIDDLSWLEPLQYSIAKPTVLYSQNAPINGVLGLVNCLRKEPSESNVSMMLIMDDTPPFNIQDDFYKKQLEKNLAINVFKDGQWGSYRHLLLADEEDVEVEHCYADITTTGDLSSLRWIEGPPRVVSDLKKEFVNIYYSALTFKDVMLASGQLQVDEQECVLGFEFSGKLANDSSKRLMGMTTNGALATMVAADTELLWSFPDDWSLEDAATVPVVYSTVLYAFIMRGRIKPGQSVLIHSGTGGVGQAAINIASHMRCIIFTTVGTEEKREFIKKHYPHIKEEHIGDSRSESFEQMVLTHTNGRGVDFILNSLTQEKLLASVRCLAYNGTFLEIGKFDLQNDNQLSIELMRKQARYEGIMLEHLIRENKEVLSKLLNEGIINGSIKPLVRSVFGNNKLEESFRYMSTGKHIGKVLIKIRDEETNQLFKAIPRFTCVNSGCYIIVGGLGGFGLELADWLVNRGAKHIVLTSRNGIKNTYQVYRLNILKSKRAKVIVRNDNIGTEEACKTLLTFAETLGPVDAIFNLAVVLRDGLFENQTEETFKISLKPKAYATRYLDTVSRGICRNLRHFVVFSSMSCGRGNAGQTNYGMANSVMERICEKRKKEGYPALAIQWGAIGEVGLVAEMQNGQEDVVIGGTVQQKISNCFHILDRLLKQDEPIVLAEKKIESGTNNIFDSILNVIGVTSLKTISLHATFPELGMDSMMTVEIKQILERDHEIVLTTQDIRNMTIAKLKDLVTD